MTISIANYLCGREEQLHILQSLISDAEEFITIPTLFLFGASNTGKSLTLRHIFQPPFKARYMLLSMTLILTEAQFFSKILTFLHGESLQCDNFAEFIDALHDFSASKPIYIVLEEVENILTKFSQIFPPLLRLREFVPKCNVSFILTSRWSWDRYTALAHHICPVQIYFPVYKMAELKEILLLDLPRHSSPTMLNMGDKVSALYTEFLTLALRVFYPFCNQLKELRKIVSYLWPIYISPIEEGRITSNDAAGLYQAIQPALRSGQLLFSQFISHTSITSSSDQLSSVESVPMLARYLLIAAYMASYNPAKLDSRLFGDVDAMPKSRKKFYHAARKNHLVTPKLFPLERLLAIFYNISDDVIVTQSNMQVWTALSTLVQLGYLQRVGPFDKIDEVKIRCLCNLDYVEKLAKSVRFDIHAFLVEGQTV